MSGHCHSHPGLAHAADPVECTTICGAAGGASSSSLHESSAGNHQEQIRLLLEEKERVQRDRDQLASEQGLHKGRIAQLEGLVAANERRIKLLLDELDLLKEESGTLRTQLQQAEQKLDLTPQRCRVAAKQLQDEADRAWGRARTQEVQVRRLRQVVQHEAQEMSELVEFTEQERQMLVEQQSSLKQRLSEVLTLTDANAVEMEQLQQELESSRGQVAQLTSQVEEAAADRQRLQQQAAQQEQALADSRLQQEAAEAAQQAAVAEARQAQQEAAAAQEQSRSIFRQVRFVSHVLDKNAALLGKVPELQGLARELRALVGSNTSSMALAAANQDQGSTFSNASSTLGGRHAGAPEDYRLQKAGSAAATAAGAGKGAGAQLQDISNLRGRGGAGQ